jgi:hypothetical protein
LRAALGESGSALRQCEVLRRLTLEPMMRLVPLAALAVLAASQSASAYTAAEAKHCMNDAFKLCSKQIPDVDKVAQCMREKRNELTPGCAEAVDRFFATGSIKRDKPVVYRN